MQKNVTRTVAYTKITWGEIYKDENGNPCVTDEDPVIADGLLEEDEALGYLRKNFGRTKTYFIQLLDHIQETRVMPLEDFISHSEIVKFSHS